eukprot:4993751-Amphidinium_carterae.1
MSQPHPAAGTPLPNLILQPGGVAPGIVDQNPHRDSAGYEPNPNLPGARTPCGFPSALMPPPPAPPLSGRG